MRTPTASITIRPAYADDALALVRLAALDSADSPPPAPCVVAEVDGKLRAALSLADGSAIADPFFATADVVALLRAHVAAGGGVGWRRLHRKFGWRRSIGVDGGRSRLAPTFRGQ